MILVEFSISTIYVVLGVFGQETKESRWLSCVYGFSRSPGSHTTMSVSIWWYAWFNSWCIRNLQTTSNIFCWRKKMKSNYLIQKLKKFDKLIDDSQQVLYLWCKQFSKLPLLFDFFISNVLVNSKIKFLICYLIY